MNEKEKKQIPDVEELIKKAAAIFVMKKNIGNPSIENSDVANMNNTDVVILRDSNSKILAHYQHIEDDSFKRLDKMGKK